MSETVAELETRAQTQKRLYNDGLEAAARWHENRAATIGASPTGLKTMIAPHLFYAANIRKLKNE